MLNRNRLISLIIFFLFLVFLVLAVPTINFLTPVDNLFTTNNFVEINVSITETNLNEIIYNWNGTNFTYYNDSLVLMFNFDNIAALGENSTHAFDLSNSKNNGSVNVSALTSTGKYGGTFEFDGLNDYVNVVDSGVSGLDVTEITIGVWVNPSNLYVISDRGIILNKENVYEVGLQNGTGALQTAFSPGCWAWEGTGVIPLDTWTYVTVVHNGTHRLHYINGNLTDAFACPGSITANDNDLKIGARGGDGPATSPFNGSIDEVRVWNRALSIDEIYQQYISNLKKINPNSWELYVNQSKNLTAGFDEGSYTYFVSAKDSSNNENIITRTITRDLTFPTWENNQTDLTINTLSGSTVYFNITLNDNNPDKYIFSWYNGTSWVNDSAVSYTNGQEISTIKIININNGDINWTWHFNDSIGNSNQTDFFGMTLVNDVTYPLIDFTYLTPVNNTIQSTTNFEVNVSINEANLNEVKYNWNGTNFSMYNDSLILMMNFDSYTLLNDTSSYENDGSYTSIITYQETADSYYCTGGWDVTNGCANVMDGNYGTYGFTPLSNGSIFINYTKPASATSAIWQKKNYDGTPKTYNHTIPNACFQQSPLQLQLFDRDGGNMVRWDCWNGTDWQTVQLTTAGSWVYEEAIYWESSNSPIAVQGKYGEAYDFDGINDYVDIGSNNLGTDFSIGFWMKASQLYDYGDPLGSEKRVSFVTYADGHMNYIVGNGSWGSVVNTGVGALTTNQWYYVLGTFDGTTSKLYIDGNINGTAGNSLTVGLTNLTIGARYNAGSIWYPFNGSVDEVRIWNRSLSAGEVYQQYVSNLKKIDSDSWELYVNQSKNTTEGLDDGTYTYFTSAKDSSGNENITTTRTITIDASFPSWVNNKTNLTTNTLSGSTVYFNITLNDNNPDKYIFSWYNGTNWENDSAVSYTNGQEISIIKTININNGDINWTWYFNDSLGNSNQTDVFGMTLVNDVISPLINFVDPTPENATTQYSNSVYVNITSSDANNHSVFIDWNKTLIGWWSFENVLSDGIIYDNSTYNNHGAMVGFTSNITTQGKYGQGVDFNGGNYINTLDDQFDISTGENFTFSAWIKTSNKVYNPRIFSKRKIDGDRKGYECYIAATPGFVACNFDDGGTNPGLAGSQDLTDNVWHYVVITISGTTVTVYVDGNLDGSNTNANLDDGYDNDETFRIGATTNIGTNFTGMIDEVKIYSRALSIWEINASYNANLYQYRNNFTGLDEGNYNYQVYVTDLAGNNNQTEERIVTIDTSFPTWENNKTDLTTNTISGSTVYFNITLNDLNPEKYIFSWYNGTAWENDSATSYTNGQEISVIKITNINNGDINWTWYFNDTLGNLNQTDVWSVTIIFIDTDNDGLPDSSDPLLYNETNVTTSGVTTLNITVAGNSTSGSYTGVQEVVFYDSSNKLFNFTHNFSASNLDLSKVTISKETNSILINLSSQLQGNKTVYITDNSFVSLCVKDEEISSINEISSACNGSNETDFTSCLGSNLALNGINCTDQGSIIKIENLKHSGIRGTQATPSSTLPPTGTGKSRANIIEGIFDGNVTGEYECIMDSECPADETCYYNQCLKLFDAKIIDIDSPVQGDGLLDFTYFIKGMANISGDVIINFWLDKDGEVVSSGQDVIYLGSFEEKTEKTKIFIPNNLSTGPYTFNVQVSFENYQATTLRTIFVEQGEVIKVTLQEPVVREPKSQFNPYLFVTIVLILILILVSGVFYWKYEELKTKIKYLSGKFRRNKKKSKPKKPKVKKTPKKLQENDLETNRKRMLIKGLLKAVLSKKLPEEPNKKIK